MVRRVLRQIVEGDRGEIVSRLVRCRRCHALIVSDWFIALSLCWALCPCCRAPLPLNGGALDSGQGQPFSYPLGAA